MTQAIQPWMYDVLKRPLVTEKTTQNAEGNWVTFEVEKAATKPRIKQAFEAIYNVKAERINTLIQNGKVKGMGGRKGVRSDVKKAMIKLPAGHNVDLAKGV